MLENLIDAILGNLFFVVIIVGGLISFFSDRKKKEEARNKEENQRKQKTPTSQTIGRVQPEAEKGSMERKPTERTTLAEQMNQSNQKDIKSVDQLRKEQLKRLKGTISSNGETHKNDNSNTSYSLSEKKLSKSTQFNSDFIKNLNEKKLAENIIFSEVLGKPRSLKPYRRE